jgi:hypothetical protein
LESLGFTWTLLVSWSHLVSLGLSWSSVVSHWKKTNPVVQMGKGAGPGTQKLPWILLDKGAARMHACPDETNRLYSRTLPHPPSSEMYTYNMYIYREI